MYIGNQKLFKYSEMYYDFRWSCLVLYETLWKIDLNKELIATDEPRSDKHQETFKLIFFSFLHTLTHIK